MSPAKPHTPRLAAGHTPGQTPRSTAGLTPDQTPDQSSEKTPGLAPEQISQHAPGPKPWRILARFPHPEPQQPAHKARILPVFLPFAGCPQRCVFCDQAAQTGQTPEPLDALYHRLEALLSQPPAVDASAGSSPVSSSHASPGSSLSAARNAASNVGLGAPCGFLDRSPSATRNAAPGATLDADLGKNPAQRSAESPQPAQELAFYGGTFTALPEPWPRRFMELAGRYLASGRLSRIRCSTRPDAVDPARLAELKALGLSLVELGVQSFDDTALSASQRGYDGQPARRACRAVGEAGLSLGIQLMPGLPGHTPAAFQADVAQTAAFAPELTRLYPCLVLAGTPLAERWRAGAYAPWGLEATVEQLALALPVLWAAGVPTARMGLAEQQGLAVLAGPRHPALGQMARSVALLAVVRQRLAELARKDTTQRSPTILALPRRLQGEALGHQNALAPHYAALGLALHFWDEAELALCAL